MKRAAAMITVMATLAGCGSMRSVSFAVSEGEAPTQGALVRAVPLTEGVVPLPLSDATIQEILLAKKKQQQAVTNERGVVRLRLRSGVAHLVEVESPAWRSAAQEQQAWILDADGGQVERADGAAAGRYELRVARSSAGR